jgi:hypothetical protein
MGHSWCGGLRGTCGRHVAAATTTVLFFVLHTRRAGRASQQYIRIHRRQLLEVVNEWSSDVGWGGVIEHTVPVRGADILCFVGTVWG